MMWGTVIGRWLQLRPPLVPNQLHLATKSFSRHFGSVNEPLHNTCSAFKRWSSSQASVNDRGALTAENAASQSGTYTKYESSVSHQRKKLCSLKTSFDRQSVLPGDQASKGEFRTIHTAESSAERDLHLRSVFALICAGVLLSGFTRHFIAQRTERGAFLQALPDTLHDPRMLVTEQNRQLPLIVTDPDPYFDLREKKYKEDLERYDALCHEAAEREAKEDAETPSMGYGWAQTFVNFFAGYDFNDALEKKKQRRLLSLSKLEPPVFRTASAVRIGLRHISPENLDRYIVGLIPVHDQKLCMVSLISGYGGHAMAEYARQTLHLRLQKAITASPLYLLLQSIRHAFERLDEDLKRFCTAASELNFYDCLNMGLYILTVLIDANTLYIANIGDGKAVVSREGKPYLLSVWHGADSNYEQRLLMQTKRREQDTVQCRTKYDVPRKVHGLASLPFWATSTLGYDTVTSNCLIKGLSPVTRGLGHFALKDPILGEHLPEMKGSSGYPYVYGLPSTAAFPRTKYDDFLILGTGGFWDYVEEKEAVALVYDEFLRRARMQDKETKSDRFDYAQKAADILATRALENYKAFRQHREFHYQRDITVMVIPLNLEAASETLLPNLNPQWRLEDKKKNFFKRCIYWFIPDPDNVMKTADYRTKLRWLYDRRLQNS